MKDMLNAWQRVIKARRKDRPTAQNYINRLIDGFIELHGDRLYSDDKAIIAGLGKLGGINVTVIGQEKGISLNEKVERNFGMPNPEGYRKSLRLMKQAEKFKRPIICIVDTQGAFCGLGAEERGQGEAIARNLFEMSKLKVPIISVIIGEGGSGGALALAVSDRVWMLENAIYSILSPEGFASILYKDSSKAPQVAEEMKITAEDLYGLKVIDKIIEEPLDGAHESFDDIVEALKVDLINELEVLSKESTEDLLEKRYNKFRQFYY